MRRIGLLSDTHGTMRPDVLEFLSQADEIWHAGDIGRPEVLIPLQNIGLLRAVYGNIDGLNIRKSWPEYLHFTVEEVSVLLIHIGGSPGRYFPSARRLISKYRPNLFVSGHSHILKVMYDEKNQLLFMNPGAAGNSGFHKHITAIRFQIDGKDMRELEVFELKRNR